MAARTAFDETAAETLIWFRPQRIKRRFELRRDQAVVATLTCDPPRTFAWGYTDRRPASAEASDGKWRLTVVRRGFLGLKADVHVEGTHSGVLEAGYFLRKGTLRLSETLAHRWAGGLEESSSDAFNDLQGFPVLRLDRGNYFEGVNARVSIPSGTPPTLASLLACLGLYMRLLMNKVYD
jgi:hypothetical protein